MKQFVASLVPDKAVAWKLAAMVLLFLLVAVMIVNLVVPFAVALFAPAQPADVTVSGQAAAHLVQSEAQGHQTIAELEKRETETSATIDQLKEQIAQYEALIAELQNQGAADAAMIEDLKIQIDLLNKQIEQLTLERDALREQLSKDYIIVFKLTRFNLFGGVAQTLTHYYHTNEAEYAMYHIGDVVEKIADLDFSEEDGWTVEVSNMMINLVDV